VNLPAVSTISFYSVILAITGTYAMEEPSLTEYFSGDKRYIHLAARECSLFVGTTDTSEITLTRRGDITVTTVSSTADSMRIICGGANGYTHLLVPLSVYRPAFFIEFEESNIRMENISTDSVHISGIDGSITMETCGVEYLVAVMDQSTVHLDTQTDMLLLNTIDSRVLLQGHSKNLTFIGEGGTLKTETMVDTLMYDLNNVRSEIVFMNHAVNSGLIIGYRGEMSISVPEVSLNSLLLHIRDGDYSVDTSLSVTMRSRENGYKEISTATDREVPCIRIITDGSRIKLSGSP